MPARLNEDGETLIELVISMLIIGIAVSAFLIALATTSGLSAEHRRDATADAVLRGFVEAVKATAYNSLGATTYVLPAAEFTQKAGYPASVTSVKCLTNADASGNASTSSATDFITCTVAPNTDLGLQLVTAFVTYSGKTQTVSFLKRKP